MTILSAVMAAPITAIAADESALMEKARQIHERVLTVDTHVDIPLDYATQKNDPGGFSALQVDLPKMRAGGLDAPFFIVYTPQGPLTPQGYAEAASVAATRLNAIKRLVAAYPDQIALATTAEQARRIARSGRRVAFIGMENAYPVGPELASVDDWAAAGVRYAGITHFGHNQFGDSSNPNADLGDTAEKWGGLSPLGRDLIAALNRAGIMVDVSHAGRETMMQTVELSAAPIIASHSGVKALADSPRNLDDEQLRALAAKGGVAQIVALDVYLKPFTAAQTAARDKIRVEMKLTTPAARDAMTDDLKAVYEARMKAEVWSISARASVKDLVDHIDHAVKVAGIDHVGIASDFDGGGGIDGWQDASETFNVTAELVRRGYTEEAIAKIWGGNLLRVLDEAQKTATRLNR
jgi:membrane dipeptidase